MYPVTGHYISMIHSAVLAAEFSLQGTKHTLLQRYKGLLNELGDLESLPI